MTERGRPIDESDLPGWAEPYFSAEQRKRLDPLMLWILLLCKSATLEDTRLHLAHRLHVYMLTLKRGAQMEWSPGMETLAGETNLSQKTIEACVSDLEEQGWIVVTRRRRKTNTYRLAWPHEDHLTGTVGPDRYARPTNKDRLCMRPAGYGTATPGVGPCIYHGGDPKPKHGVVGPQPMGPNDPVDNSLSTATNAVQEAKPNDVRPQSTQKFDRNERGVEPQPLRGSTYQVVPPELVSENTSLLLAEVEGAPDRSKRRVDDQPRDGPEEFRRASIRLVDLDAAQRQQLMASAQDSLGVAAARKDVIVRAAALADEPSQETPA